MPLASSANAFDAGHQVNKIAQLAKKLARALNGCFQFQLIFVRGFDAKHSFFLAAVLSYRDAMLCGFVAAASRKLSYTMKAFQ